jgi:hypothetical protein
MARQAGDIFIEGTIDDLTFYKMEGVYLVREKSSLTAKRFWTDRAFEGSRKSCSELARASKIASHFYSSYPKENKRKGLFNEMTGKVKLWLKDSKGEKEILRLLVEKYLKEDKSKSKTIADKTSILQCKKSGLKPLVLLYGGRKELNAPLKSFKEANKERSCHSS